LTKEVKKKMNTLAKSEFATQRIRFIIGIFASYFVLALLIWSCFRVNLITPINQISEAIQERFNPGRKKISVLGRMFRKDASEAKQHVMIQQMKRKGSFMGKSTYKTEQKKKKNKMWNSVKSKFQM